MKLEIPYGALVVLIGPSGAGKSSFAREHFLPTEVVSSDACRGLVSDDENNQAVSREAFELVHFIARQRLGLQRLTVIDATNVRREERRSLIQLAREAHALPVAVVFDIAEEICHARNAQRPDRDFGAHVVRRHRREMLRGLRGLQREGFRYVYTFRSPDEVAHAEVERTPLWTDKTELAGPFDIIGDIHGCYDELLELFTELGYTVDDADGRLHVEPPAGRTAIFLGDYGDRGPRTPEVFRLVMAMVAGGSALALPGNHDVKLGRYLDGRNVRINHGLAETIEQFERLAPEETTAIRAFISSLVSHYVLDAGRLVVAHAGLPEELQGRSSRTVRDVALYGLTTGRTDDYDLPERLDWAADYRGEATVVYGHTPVAEPIWRNGTLNIDTGCVFGGSLTALRYPERTLVSVPARRTYYAAPRPIAREVATATDAERLLDVADYLGRQTIQTRLLGNVTINELNAAAALETMARFAIDPRLLIYLPPTMSPPATSRLDGLLEHPSEAFAYYRERGAGTVVCQTKHMGSRAIVVLGRDAAAFARRFGVSDAAQGIVYTRTGRRFFKDFETERALLEELAAALDATRFWTEHETDWLALDCELMPWSLKAGALIRQQYAAVGVAAEAALGASLDALKTTAERGINVSGLLEREAERLTGTREYIDAYRHYMWPVDNIADVRLAPFQLLATEGRTYFERPHDWHMATIAKVCAAGSAVLHATDQRIVDLLDEAAVAETIDWWSAVCAAGGEGMVVKPAHGIVRAEGRLVQPAMKVRGPHYLRIIYGPDYDRQENLGRLRRRSTGRKRGLAAREFALGVEALERFVRHEPLRRTHACVFGVLALESEPIDPRL